MGCATNTNSIASSTAGGVLEADLILDPSAQNLLSVSAAGVLASLNGGWISVGATLAFSSAASPTFVATTSIDLTGIVPVGSKFSLVQSSVTLYFIVTAVSSTTITLYGGTTYTLANSAITVPSFSYMNSPIGFPRPSSGWSVIVKSTSNLSQASPVNGTWYNIGSLSMTVPIGSWKISFQVNLESAGAGSGDVSTEMGAALSTASTSASDPDLHGDAILEATETVSGNLTLQVPVYRTKTISVVAATPYYLNGQAQNSTNLFFRGDRGSTVLMAVCDYL